MRHLTAWARAHASVLLILAVLAVGGVFYFVGIWLVESSPAIAGMVFSLAGALVAVAITAVFFNLPDTAGYMTNQISKLITSGELATILSREAQERFLRSIFLQRVGDRVSRFEDDLFCKLMELSDSWLSAPFLSGYHYSASLKEDPDHPGLFINESIIRYRVHVAHLRAKPFPHHVAYHFAWQVDKDDVPDNVDLIERFTLEIDGNTFGRGDITLTREERDGKVIVSGAFERIVPLKHDADLNLIVSARTVGVDPVDVLFFKYPVKGFSGDFRFDEHREFDVSVFRPDFSNTNAMACGSPTHRSSGVDFSCRSEWALPGSGFAFHFPPKSNYWTPTQSRRQRRSKKSEATTTG